MREILFRGKHVLDGRWIEGFYNGVRPDLETMQAKECHRIFSLKSLSYDIDPDTIGQFTGLTDKNGTKIFEGDIVKRCFTLTRGPHKETREKQVGVVCYDDVTCGYLIRGACNLRRQWPGDTIEGIGNIYDNPELMEGE